MSYYKYHLFFCTNIREGGDISCGPLGGQTARNYVKRRVKALGDGCPGNVRINSAGCLNRCDKGPVIVVYPEATWYTYVDNADLDEIIESHLVKGQRVARLLIDS